VSYDHDSASPVDAARRDAARTSGSTPVLRWLCLGMLVAIVAGGAGFAYKLVQFSREAFAAEEASFAVVPVVVYVCVAAGFVSLFVWALLRGQFTRVEEPKLRLLEEEERYDREGI